MYSASSLKDHPFNEHIPEVVILGASNVGKSTFLNALVSRSGIARVSAKPGRTTVMNAFGVGPPPHIPKRLISKGTRPPNESLIVMDTPGYGYRSQKSWGNTIVKYLGSRKTLRGAVVLLSSEKKLLPDDRWLLEQLAIANTRTIVVLTKADKAKGGGDWAGNCTQRAEAVMQELKELGRWRKREEAWMPEIYVTAVGMMNATRLGNNAGLGGVRAAILEMAGFDVKDDVTKQDEAVSYTGKIVSFDDIQWKP
jgi:GTP-binding protein